MSEYPFTYADREFPLLSDDDLERLIRDKCGDDVAMLLHHRLYGNYDETTLKEQIEYLRDAYDSAESLATTLSDLVDYFDKIRKLLPAGGVLP